MCLLIPPPPYIIVLVWSGCKQSNWLELLIPNTSAALQMSPDVDAGALLSLKCSWPRCQRHHRHLLIKQFTTPVKLTFTPLYPWFSHKSIAKMYKGQCLPNSLISSELIQNSNSTVFWMNLEFNSLELIHFCFDWINLN
jgi:hypothetical protein